MKSEILSKFEQLAFKRTNAFCYSCYHTVKTTHCPTCGSDDFARELNGVGVDYNTDWVIQHILKTELEPINLEEAFEESVRECYPEETAVGWMTFDTATLMKTMDPVWWNIAQSEWSDNETEDGQIVSFDNGATYFRTSDVETFINDNL